MSSDLHLNSQAQSIPKKFPYPSPFKHALSELNDSIQRQIPKISNPSTVIFSLEETDQKFQDKDLIDLSKILLKNQSISHLLLNLEMCYDITNEGLIRFCYALEKLRALQTLRLSFRHLGRITSKGFHQLLKSLTRLPRLQDFSLYFAHNEFFTGAEFQALRKTLKKMPSLKKLTFHFHECVDVLDQNLATICKGISELRLLESVHLSFIGCYYLTGKGIENLSASKSRYLKTVLLDFSLCGKIHDASVNTIIQSLQALPSLQNIGLGFMSVPITETALLHLEQGLLKMKDLDLKSLYFNFQNCFQITTRGISSLTLALTSFKNSLENLALNFRNNPFIGDASLSSFAEFFKQAKALQSLKMILHDCSSITNKGFKSFCDGLQSLDLIKSLELDFSNSKELSDEVFSALGTSLKEKGFLEDLNLQFCLCPDVTDVGLESFNQGLEQVKSLRSLRLAFILFPKITDQGLRSLFQALKHLASLITLELDLDRCLQITGENFNMLNENLGNSLKYFVLNVERCKVSKESIDDFTTNLSKNSKIRQCIVQA